MPYYCAPPGYQCCCGNTATVVREDDRHAEFFCCDCLPTNPEPEVRTIQWLGSCPPSENVTRHFRKTGNREIDLALDNLETLELGQSHPDIKAGLIEAQRIVYAASRLQWVSCKDRLPAHDQQVLFYHPEDKQSREMVINIGTFTIDRDGSSFGTDEYTVPREYVTHWMPLPKRPAE